ncbi:hypothetical protein [Armatimonas rosea]|uniref:Spy/CpxP family protein refolding chaperone n=1 Tax=Armatimonas rosea TaxID=685828 RepID=A0A7W9W9N1_ARMRO|nr:hypothetical protein [Armatimonas rosea]MBB6053400.1 Spy/CpxP family protein refolding chaperone [Armatimonas rosea]
MNLKRFSLLCSAALALVATTAFAQDTKPGTGAPGQDTKPAKGERKANPLSAKALEKALELKPEQVEKLKPAFKKLADTRKELATVTDRKEKSEKMAAATKELVKSIEEVLTPEQKTKFDEIKKTMAAGKKGKKKNN